MLMQFDARTVAPHHSGNFLNSNLGLSNMTNTIMVTERHRQVV